MSNIYYFNINYYCNNDCIYCFSSTTGREKREMPLDVLKKIVDSVNPNADDKIIINGGEPSIHTQFYEIILFLTTNYESEIVIYTNGRNLALEELKILKDIRFVIPIHGSEKEHNYITQNKNAYKETLSTLKCMQSLNMNYVIKFIINYEMIMSQFSPIDFLDRNNLRPLEIMLARLNETKKSKFNGVLILDEHKLKIFLSTYAARLNRLFKVKYLDIPFCYFEKEFDFKNLSYNPSLPAFYFSDDRNHLVKRNYFKDVKIGGEKCQSCKYEQLCNIMKNSYLTLCWNSYWNLVTE